eukprot:7004642-Alexandrium_andersonii.AAC.1
MSTWPLGKEGDWAIDVSNEPGGQESGKARGLGPHPEADRLGDGGRGGALDTLKKRPRVGSPSSGGSKP